MHSNILYKIKPQAIQLGVHIQYLAVSYSHMGMPHTTIGASAFHFWVRYGVRWDHRSIAARIIPLITSSLSFCSTISSAHNQTSWFNLKTFSFFSEFRLVLPNTQNPWALYS